MPVVPGSERSRARSVQLPGVRLGRLLRIGDRRDEVHLRQIFKLETPPAWKIADSPYITRPEETR